MSVDDASADGSRGCCQPSDALAMCYGLWPWKRLHCSVVAMAMCWGEAGREEGEAAPVNVQLCPCPRSVGFINTVWRSVVSEVIP